MKNLLKKNQLMITALAIMIAVAGYLQFAGTDLDEEDYLPTSGNAEILNGAATENLNSSDINSDYNLDGLLDLSEEDLAAAGLNDIESLDSDADGLAGNYLDTDMNVNAPADGSTAANGTAADGGTPADGAAVADGGTPADGTTVADGSTVTQNETPENGEIPGEAVFTSGTGVATVSEAKLLKEQVRAKNKETLLDIINSTGLTDQQKQNAVDTMVQMTAIAEKEMAAEILLEAKGFSDVVVSINGGSVDVVVNALELTEAQRAQIEDIVKRKTEIDAANIIISTVVQ